MKNVIGLIHPKGIRHYQSKMLCNNPDIIITRIRPTIQWPNWYTGDFTPCKDVGIFKKGKAYCIFGFRPRYMIYKGC